MSDRANEPTDRPDLSAGGSAGSDGGASADEIAFRALVGIDDLDDFADLADEDLFDGLEPNDIDDVAFGLDVNPDDVDLTFDPNWHSSVSDRGWGESWGE